MKLGATFNLFDNEELLEKSCLAIRKFCHYICVVWQDTSNFGQKHPNPRIKEFYDSLVKKNIINELIYYKPKVFNPEEKRKLVSKSYTGDPTQVLDQFCNEITKREVGRLHCFKNGCTHFMSMDADEFYLPEQMTYATSEIMKNDYEMTACRMRILFKKSTLEYYPYDDLNAVTFICKIIPNGAHRIDEPCQVVLDPTRKITNVKKFYMFKRQELEMFHMSFIRKNMRLKLENTSNKHNIEDVEEFLVKFNMWDESMLDVVVHPHAIISQQFKEIRKIPNYFSVNLDDMCQTCCVTDDLVTVEGKKYCKVCK